MLPTITKLLKNTHERQAHFLPSLKDYIIILKSLLKKTLAIRINKIII